MDSIATLDIFPNQLLRCNGLGMFLKLRFRSGSLIRRLLWVEGYYEIAHNARFAEVDNGYTKPWNRTQPAGAEVSVNNNKLPRLVGPP